MTAHTLNPGSGVNVLTGIVGIRSAAEGVFPLLANHVGYTEDGQTKLNYASETTDISVAEERSPIETILTGENTTIDFQLAEATLENLTRAMMGADNDVASMLRIKDGSEKFQSYLLEGEAPGKNNGIRQILVLKGGSIGSVGIPFGHSAKQVVPCQIKCFVPPEGETVYVFDLWDFTISTGAVAYSAAKLGMRLSGEAAAADDLDTITGATSGDRVLVKIADATQPITLVHAVSGDSTFSLGGSDIVLDDMRDWVELLRGASQWTVNASHIFA